MLLIGTPLAVRTSLEPNHPSYIPNQPIFILIIYFHLSVNQKNHSAPSGN
jgi:hypothetical protein